MIRSYPIKKVLCSVGASAGLPCLSLETTEDDSIKEQNVNAVIEELLSFTRLRNVLVSGDLMKQPELVTVIRGLSGRGKRVIFLVPASCPIETVRLARGLKIIMVADAPTSKSNDFDPRNLQYLKEGDELVMNIPSLKAYREAKAFLEPKTISRPVVLFKLEDSFPLEEIEEFMTEYFQDVERFFFASRIVRKLELVKV